MKKRIIFVFLLLPFIFCNNSYSQSQEVSNITNETSKLFRNQEILPIKLTYSNKDIKKNTNDSTYIKTDISYQEEDGSWKTFEVELRSRGNNRLKNCYFPPIKMKISNSESKGTLFEGNKKIKLVLPCLLLQGKNDYVVKEYMAYKLYEIISPYHYNTRIVDLSFTENKGKKTKIHELKAILIEDIKNIAKRYDGHLIKTNTHHSNQEPKTSVQNAFFQFMIGNTDFSTTYQHNEKLLFINKKFVPVPFDFDMSGLVNTSYAVVSVVNNESLPISSVEDRLYRGYERDPQIIQEVRKEFMDNKIKMMDIIDNLKPLFEDQSEFAEARKYILSFFEILVDDDSFESNIIEKLRTQ